MSLLLLLFYTLSNAASVGSNFWLATYSDSQTPNSTKNMSVTVLLSIENTNTDVIQRGGEGKKGREEGGREGGRGGGRREGEEGGEREGGREGGSKGDGIYAYREHNYSILGYV